MSPIHNSHPLNSDQRVEQDIRAEVALFRDITDTHSVGIRVENGVVHLTGSTETYSRKWAIERAVARVIGVREVLDFIIVRPADDYTSDDGEIQRAATAILHWDTRVPDGVRAHVTDGVLRLDGVVERFSDREAAEDAVRNLIGVRDVINEIRVSPPQSSSPDLLAEVSAAIRRRFASGCRFLAVSVDDGVVQLRGTVPTFALLDDVERAIQSIPGVKRIDNQLLVAGKEEAS